MRTHLLVALSLITIGVGLPMAATADHKRTDCEITSSEADLAAEGNAVFVDEEELPDAVSVWVYQESNAFDGIQRDDSVVQDELCTHEPDTIVL